MRNLLNRKPEIKTAILVLAGISLFIFGFSFLKRSSIFDNNKIIHTVYDEVEGLVVGAKVTINGLVIGNVSMIDFLPGSTKIIVSMRIEKDLNFSPNSKAIFYEAGLIGGKAISIEPVFDSKKMVKNNDTIPSGVKPGLTELINRQIAPLQEKIESMLTSVDSLFSGVSNVLNYETQNNLKNTLENLSESVNNINKSSGALIEVIEENRKALSSTFENTAKATKNINNLTDSISKIDFTNTFNKISESLTKLDTILSKVQTGNGTLGRLISDEELYQNLTQSSKELKALLYDLKANPNRYVQFSLFGKKQKPYQPKK
ncbi:MAG: MlaD family protein [Bacteroidota bacterium]|nr:MlaD family protein [Bacteroidota bacterium]